MRHIDPDLDIAEKPTAPLERLAIERVAEALDLLMVRCHAAAKQPPWRGEPVEQVDLHLRVGSQQAGGGECTRGPGADDRDSRTRCRHHTAVRSAVLCSAKKSAFSSSA